MPLTYGFCAGMDKSTGQKKRACMASIFCPAIYCRCATCSTWAYWPAKPGRNALLHVGLQHAESLLVPLDRQLQGVQHPLGREEIRDDPLRDRRSAAWERQRAED